MPRRVAGVAIACAFSALLSVSLETRPSGIALAQAPAHAASVPIDTSAAARWDRAVEAWNTGNYTVALADLIPLMQSSSAADYLERVAILSGELFTTTELTTDGRSPALSADGEYASFEIGSPAAMTTRVVRTSEPAAVVAELRGVNVAFDASSRRLVYQRPPDGPEWTAAASALETATTAAERLRAQSVASFWLGKGDLVVRDLASGMERIVSSGTLLKTSPLFAADGRHVIFIAADPSDLSRSDIYVESDAGPPMRLTDRAGYKSSVLIDPGGAAIVYTASNVPTFIAPVEASSPVARISAPASIASAAATSAGGAARSGAPDGPPVFCGAAGGRGGGRGTPAPSFGVIDLAARSTRDVIGANVTMSAGGRTLAWLARTPDGCSLFSSPTLGEPVRTVRVASRLDAPAVSPDGQLVAYQTMLPTGTDWEIFVTTPAGAHQRITREIQHDVLPRFLSNRTLLGMIGEPRHRRSYLYDLDTNQRTRLFANNTIRTISPEYVWLPSADGRRLLIQAERDGDTVSPERGIYVVDLSRKVTQAQVLARLQQQLASETDLRQRMTTAFRPIRDLVRKTVAGISPTRAYAYAKAMFDFDSKYVSQPGNAKAIDYLNKTYASFGYTPELQWFAPAQAQGGRTANVVVTLRGTENPDLAYVVSSHFDSVAGGPGADDDTSGTCALLETARVLAHSPLPATVIFASFTGEEAGLLGSREFVRLAADRHWNIAGALNNDMIGWAGEGARLDNTIRYSNAGIRDIQHGAAFLFTRLVTFDARYYKGTDAQAFFDGWGDIVGGLGSYPVLGNPNYHQPTDLLETVNFDQVAETAKVTAATIVYLASSPSRLKDLTASKSAAGIHLSWRPSPEAGVKSYLVAYGPEANPMQHRLTVTQPLAALPALPPGTVIEVKAVNSRGLEGWDWAKTVLQ
jgi:hypothetical protein